ncbi:unnamed protein product [Brassicogethes aeneus]|uniref:Tetraspanin n=1 Tax=Brassicogethes aeneus TaxID=1431903 RepID=A0A9P0B2X4_BRAAE|nr:unnamed protein product [Brassicogethes aeneus]
MGCASGTVKLLLQTANLLFCLAGLGLIAIGGLTLNNYHKYDDAIPDDFQSLQLAPIFTIVVGSIIFFISFMGCCGACQENTCMLSTYAVILLGILLVQVGLGIYAFMEIKNDDQLQHAITKQLEIIYKNDKDHEVRDMIEKELQCCGYDGFITSALNGQICIDPTKPPCDKAILNLIHTSFKYLGYTLLGMLATELICSVFALFLVNSIKNEGRRGKYYQ